MAYQSKTYSLSDEVITAIDAARAKGESPNKFLRRLLGLGGAPVILRREKRPVFQRESREQTQLDAVGPRLSDGRGKVTRETRGGKR